MATPQFVVIKPPFQQVPSSSTQVEKIQTLPLGNITKEIDRALDLLKGKPAEEVEMTKEDFGPLQTESLLLESVRAIEFSVECSEILVMLCPRALSKCGMGLGSHQN